MFKVLAPFNLAWAKSRAMLAVDRQGVLGVAEAPPNIYF